MGQVLSHQRFQRAPVEMGPDDLVRRGEALRRIGICSKTLQRWEGAGLIWQYDPVTAPDGHFIVLPAGRKQYSPGRIMGTMR